ncbi:hypothetical protein WA158_003125 [Blastocystis sp. Blastoise]
MARLRGTCEGNCATLVCAMFFIDIISIIIICYNISEIVYLNNCPDNSTEIYNKSFSSIKSTYQYLEYPKIEVNKQLLIPYIFINGSYVNYIENCVQNDNNYSKNCESKNIDYYEAKLPSSTNQIIFSIENKEIYKEYIYKKSIISSIDISTLGCSNNKCLECIRMGGILNDSKCSVKQYLQNICIHIDKQDNNYSIDTIPCFDIENTSQYTMNPDSIDIKVTFDSIPSRNNHILARKGNIHIEKASCSKNIQTQIQDRWNTICIAVLVILGPLCLCIALCICVKLYYRCKYGPEEEEEEDSTETTHPKKKIVKKTKKVIKKKKHNNNNNNLVNNNNNNNISDNNNSLATTTNSQEVKIVVPNYNNMDIDPNYNNININPNYNMNINPNYNNMNINPNNNNININPNYNNININPNSTNSVIPSNINMNNDSNTYVNPSFITANTNTTYPNQYPINYNYVYPVNPYTSQKPI